MSGGAEARELEERLREAAALGDVREVRRLLGAGADINSRNEIDGWTCLHWACKRNQVPVVSCLLDAGADRQIRTAAGELAAQLTSKPDIRKILGEEETECQGAKDLNLPIVANYVANPPFPCVHTEETIPDGLAEPQDETASVSSASQCETGPSSPAAQVRVQNLRDNDFIEIELDRQELTYQDLLRVSCCELGVNPDQVEKIRKLPNTLVRKDKDVARLQDFQELELVLVQSGSSPFRNAATALTDRACYNSRASKLTY
ncbi:ankyrin repeat domain-containing protein 40-like [Patagioenas fasciata monilis]|uniref:Ankyrin repeat domain-containing protein 40-like n=1 Tax=Patagioenas fasciata monilis TaxID=372326 RepID=A0A1V4KWJ7_PATFA|nr:ankyrin repeat domain-containing protein 40-like [Patagioenas fasciata monilis]